MSEEIDNIMEELFIGRDRDKVEIVKEDVWTTKDGRKIPVSKMEDKHLLNSICFLAAEEAKTRLLGAEVTGDRKTDKRFAELNIQRAVEKRKMLVREAKRRNLQAWGKLGMFQAAMELINAPD